MLILLPRLLRPSWEGALCLHPPQEGARCLHERHKPCVKGFIGFPCKPRNISLFLSLFYFLIINSRPPGSGPLKDLNKWCPNRSLVHVADSDRVTSVAYWGRLTGIITVQWNIYSNCPASLNWRGKVHFQVLGAQGLTGGTSGKESAKRLRFDPWVGKISWRRKWQPTPIFLPVKLQEQRSPAAYSPVYCKELDTTEQLNTHVYTDSSPPHSSWSNGCSGKVILREEVISGGWLMEAAWGSCERVAELERPGCC